MPNLHLRGRHILPPSLHPFSAVARSGPRPTHASLRRKLWRGAALTPRRRGGLPILIPPLSFLPACSYCTQISPLDGFLSLSLPFLHLPVQCSSSKPLFPALSLQAELDRSRTVLFTTRNSPLSLLNPLIIICHRHLNRNLSLSLWPYDGKMRHEDRRGRKKGEGLPRLT